MKNLYMVVGIVRRFTAERRSPWDFGPQPLEVFASLERAKRAIKEAALRDKARLNGVKGICYSIIPVQLSRATIDSECRGDYAQVLGELFPLWRRDKDFGCCAKDLPVSDTENLSWLFDQDGEPWYVEENVSDLSSDYEGAKVSPKFCPGDLVRVQMARVEGSMRCCPAVVRLIGTYNRGIVSDFHADDQFADFYSFIYFDGYTCMSSWAHERDIELIDCLPDNARVLRLLSEHYRGDIQLEESEIERVLRESLFVSSQEMFYSGVF